MTITICSCLCRRVVVVGHHNYAGGERAHAHTIYYVKLMSVCQSCELFLDHHQPQPAAAAAELLNERRSCTIRQLYMWFIYRLVGHYYNNKYINGKNDWQFYK